MRVSYYTFWNQTIDTKKKKKSALRIVYGHNYNVCNTYVK